MAKSGKDKNEKAVLQHLQTTARAARTMLAARLLELELYAGQEQILLALSGSDGITPGMLANALGVRPPTITKTLNRLQAQGFLSRQPSSDDGRQALIALTAKGDEAIGRIRKTVKKSEKKALKGIDKKEIKAFVKTLSKIEANLSLPGVAADEADEEPSEA